MICNILQQRLCSRTCDLFWTTFDLLSMVQKALLECVSKHFLPVGNWLWNVLNSKDGTCGQMKVLRFPFATIKIQYHMVRTLLLPIRPFGTQGWIPFSQWLCIPNKAGT